MAKKPDYPLLSVELKASHEPKFQIYGNEMELVGMLLGVTWEIAQVTGIPWRKLLKALKKGLPVYEGASQRSGG